MTDKYVYVLSVAASATRIGYVFWIDGQPQDWGLSLKAAKSTEFAYKFVQEKIDYYRPELLVTERPHSNPRKGEHTHKLLVAIGRAAQDADIEWCYVDRRQTFDNKYQEAEELAKSFLQLRPLVPRKRRLWEEEPREMIVFEAAAVRHCAPSGCFRPADGRLGD